MQVIATPHFEEDVKFYVKRKKHLQIYDDIKSVTDELNAGNLVGDKLAGLDLQSGAFAYKVRIANSSTNVGKSNGYRILYYVAVEEKVYLLTIYSKKDSNRIPNDAQISMMIKNVIQ
ncbi:MAG: hypothetical protein IJQ82_08780 [Selenomonadaceae bacterium]|nr:hypothetical protein [Selenomonadaceae bacterium]